MGKKDAVEELRDSDDESAESSEMEVLERIGITGEIVEKDGSVRATLQPAQSTAPPAGGVAELETFTGTSTPSHPPSTQATSGLNTPSLTSSQATLPTPADLAACIADLKQSAEQAQTVLYLPKLWSNTALDVLT